MRRLLVAAVLLVLVQAPAAHAADTGPWALFDGSPAIADPDANESINVELGTRFSVAAPASGAYWLTKVRYWRAPNRAINTNRVNVYDSSGRQVARGSLDVPDGTPGGTVDVPLAEPLRLTPGKTYTVSYSAPTGHYPSQQGAFASARDVGPVHFPADAGVYRYGGGWPTSSWASAGYYVTPVVTYDASSPPDTPAGDEAGPWSLVTDTTDIEEGAANDHQKVEVGVRFKVDTPASGAYVVKAVRFFRAKAMAENYVYIYDEDRKVVARGQFLTEGGPSGTVEVKLNAPLTLRPGVEYTASYLATYGEYADQQRAFVEPAERRAGALPGQRGRLPVRRRLPRRQLELLRLLRQPGRLLRRERDEPGGAAQHRPVGAVRRHDDDRRPGGERPGQGRARRALQRRLAAGRHLRRQGRALLPRAAAPDGREPRLRLRPGRDGRGARRGDRRGRPERGRRRAAQRAAEADAGHDLHRELRGHQRLLRERPRRVREPRTKGPLQFPADAGVYQYGGGFPTASWASSSYYVSPLVALDT